jgi:hypothetical protein
MNLRGAFPRARFWASVIVGLAYVLALLYVGGHYPFLVGLAVYVVVLTAIPYITRYLRRRRGLY